MKKWWIAGITAALLLGVGTAVYADGVMDTSFTKMLPMMKEMHPGSTEQELQNMHAACHGEGQDMSGMMDHDGMTGMMNHDSMSGMMHHGGN